MTSPVRSPRNSMPHQTSQRNETAILIDDPVRERLPRGVLDAGSAG